MKTNPPSANRLFLAAARLFAFATASASVAVPAFAGGPSGRDLNASNNTSTLSLGWFSQDDNITKRLGELRTGLFAPETPRTEGESPSSYENRRDHTAAGDSDFGIWLRGYGSRADVNLGSGNFASFSEFQYGGDLGIDFTLELGASNKLIISPFVGFQGSRRNINDDARSVDYVRAALGGVSLLWVNQDGWYANLFFKGENFYNEYRIGRDAPKHDYSSTGFGGGGEFGKQFTFGAGKLWFVEPSGQAEYFYMLGDRHHMLLTGLQSARDVDQRAAEYLRFGANIRGGINLDLREYGVLQPYARLGFRYQISNGGRVTFTSPSQYVDTTSAKPSLEDWQVSGGIGVSWQVSNDVSVHAEYEAARGDKIRIPWAVNAGVRCRF